jgi:hypothetical protein
MAIKFRSRRNFIKKLAYAASALFAIRTLPAFSDQSAKDATAPERLAQGQSDGKKKAGKKKGAKKR